MANVVEVRNLRKSFNGTIAVDDISFSVGEGECLGLLGPNGAGKTTTIRMLHGHSPPSGGQLRIFDRDPVCDLRSIKQRIGICQQEDNLDPDLDVLENLLVFARYFHIPRRDALAEARRLLGFFGLDHRAGTGVAELSGGMKRRLVLARSLINRPDLLILDEPTTGLDPQSRHQVWQRLEELKRQGLTILLTTHNMEEAARLCERLIIIDRGRILVEGSPTDLIKQHVGHMVIEITGPDSTLVDFLRSRKIFFDDLGYHLLIYRQGEAFFFEKLTREFSNESCTLRLATLEDVFLRLTGRELRE